MSEPRRIFQNTLVLGVADLVTRAGGLVLVLLISRLTYASGLGLYSTAMAYHGLMAIAGTLGSKDFLVREIAKDPARTGRYVIHSSTLAVMTSALIMLGLSQVFPHLEYSQDLIACMYPILLSVLPGTVNMVQDAVFIAHQKVEMGHDWEVGGHSD